MAGLFEESDLPVAVTIDRQIACVERELGYRRHVYARRVASGDMTQAKADEEIALMGAVRDTLCQIREDRQ